VFADDNNATIYYLPGTTGWGSTFGGLPVALLPYTFTINNGTITITKYTGPGGAVTCPDRINGLPVTSIGYMAFYYCTSLTNVAIPGSVTSIGSSAFFNCSRLASVIIPNSVTSIMDYAFSSCTSLTNLVIPGSVTSIGSSAFFNCSSLGNVTIPNGVISIMDYAFSSCTSLTSLTIPNSVTSINEGVFSDCTSLTNVAIPNSVTSIGDFAFSDCTSLSSVTIPASVTNIEESAFDSCYGLTAINVDTLNPVYSSVNGVLFNKSQTMLIQFPVGKAGSYTIPNSVTSVGDFAFYDCTSLTSVTIGNSVTSIGSYAFEYCTSLRAVYFQGNAPSVDSSVFSGDNNVTVYYLPGTSGWENFAQLTGLPTMLWNPQVQTSDASFGVRTNCFCFTITGTTNIPIVLEACTNLANPTWIPLQSCTLTNGLLYFSDPDWTNNPARFYRIRSP
jgi:hypothetical protein